MMMWLDFFLQAFVTALAWFCAAAVFAAIVAIVSWMGLKAIGATPKRRSR